LRGEVGQIEQFRPRPAAPDRVMRVAKQKKLGFCGQRRLQGIFVPLPAAIDLLQFRPL